MKKNKKKIFIIIIFFLIYLILTISDSHPILYTRYFFEKKFNTNSKYFSFANSDIDDGIFVENDSYKFNYYNPSKYFSSNPNTKTTAFDVSNFDNKSYILAERLFI